MPTKKTKAKLLSEAAAAKAHEVVIGFNIQRSDGDEDRYDVGKSKPNFVFEADFNDADWKQLVKAGAVKPAVEPEHVREDEVTIIETVEK